MQTVQQTLTTLARILNNIVQFPNEDRYKSLSMATTAYASKIAAFREAEELLRIAGFERVGDSLMLKRKDAALLWVLS